VTWENVVELRGIEPRTSSMRTTMGGAGGGCLTPSDLGKHYVGDSSKSPQPHTFVGFLWGHEDQHLTSPKIITVLGLVVYRGLIHNRGHEAAGVDQT
jgi:hypothetical protein